MAGLYNPHIYFSFFHFPFIYLTHMHIIKISFPVLFFHSSYHTSLLLTCIFMKEINLSILFSFKFQYLYIKKKNHSRLSHFPPHSNMIFQYIYIYINSINIFVDLILGHSCSCLPPSLPRGGTLRDHLSARGWLLENHSSGIKERMRVGHLEEYSRERSFGIEVISEL